MVVRLFHHACHHGCLNICPLHLSHGSMHLYCSAAPSIHSSSGGDSGVESKLRLTGGHRSSICFSLARSRRDGLGLLGTDQHLAANEQTSKKAFVDEVYSYVSNFSESPLGRHFVGPATS